MFSIDFKQEELSFQDQSTLKKFRNQCVKSIVEMTALATCGHPGGSLSTLDFLLLVYSTANHFPHDPANPDRDRVFISHGHISPGVYSTLGSFGYFPLDDAIVNFRKAGSPFGGHVENFVPGVEWNTGNLGQGLSAAVASALTAKIQGKDFRVFCCMGDGEQQKGQISEGRRFALKNKLSNLIGFVDYNKLQISGAIEKIMPQNIRAEWEASGWNVLEVEDGHNHQQLYSALRKAVKRETANPDAPTVLIARTVMGKGVSFMENDHLYHGTAPSEAQVRQVYRELGVEDRFEELKEMRKNLEMGKDHHEPHILQPYPEVQPGEPVVYGADTSTDCRSAYGKALADLAGLNNSPTPKVLGFTCDLEGSVKMKDFHKISPEGFFEAGIQEHNTATMAGRLSQEGFCVFFSTFGVFGGSEVYNQQRLNDYNHTNVKVVSTHCGLDVGEDGPTHQSLDYIGLYSNFFHFSIFYPADPNQCDRIIRHIATQPGSCFVGMGRSKMLPITKEDGSVFYDHSYSFEPGKADIIRDGENGTIIAYGPVVHKALEAHRILKEKGLKVRVVNMASLKPLDSKAVLEAAKTGLIVTVEDHHVDTGLGSLVAKVLADHGVAVPFKRLGIHQYGSSGTPEDLYQRMGLDGRGIAKALEEPAPPFNLQ